MRKSLTLSIPEPCHENWDNMNPVKQGRHCASCSKTVYDFTNKTSEDIVKAFLNNHNLCGRFKGNQLNKELVYSRKETNSFRTLLASGIFSFLTFGIYDGFSQNKQTLEQTDMLQQPTIKGKPATSILNTKMISGTIADENGIPLPGVNIIVKGSTTGTQTDFDGNYKITAEKGQLLSYSFLGYVTKEIVIGDKSVYNFSLEVSSDYLGEVVITGMISYSESYTQGYGYVQNYNNYDYTTPEELNKQKIAKQYYKQFYKNKFYKDKVIRQEKREKIRNGELERSKLGTFLYKVSHPFKKQN